VTQRLSPPPPERSFWELLPRRNLRRALFLVLALLGVLAIKFSGGLSLGKVFDQMGGQPKKSEAPAEFQHLDVRR
jgi:hypothetical protein